MRWWPWVSRRAFDEVAGERDRLRAQNDGLVDALSRIQRHQVGLPEKPREERKKEVPPMPKQLYDFIEGYGMATTRSRLKRQAFARAAKGETWEAIMTDMMATDESTGVPG